MRYIRKSKAEEEGGGAIKGLLIITPVTIIEKATVKVKS